MWHSHLGQQTDPFHSNIKYYSEARQAADSPNWPLTTVFVLETVNKWTVSLFCTVNEYVVKYPFGDTVEAEEIVPLGTVEPEEEYQPHSPAVYERSIDERPPVDFTVVAIESKDVATKPDASSLSTQKLFIDTTVFHHVDTHALEVCSWHVWFVVFCCLLLMH